MHNKELSEIIGEQIINFIIESPLNINAIPDDVERKMYEKIFNVIEESLTNDETVNFYRGCWERCKKRLFDCFAKVSGSSKESPSESVEESKKQN